MGSGILSDASDLSAHQPLWLRVVAPLAFGLVVAVRRRLPVTALIMGTAVFFGFVALGYLELFVTPFVYFYILYSAGAWSSRRTLVTVLRLLIAAALALGTVTSGWRVMRTVAARLVSLDPLKSVLANGVAATATLAAAFAVAVPVSIVYSVTAANVGTQFSGRRGVVRLRFLLPIVATALLAIPVPALLGAGFAWILLVAGV